MVVRLVRRFGVVSSEDGGVSWRRADMSDLPKIKELITDRARRVFGFADIAQVITDNALSLCQVDSNDDITFFISFSDRPTVHCVACDRWTEWFNHFYDLDNVEECNTLFVHVMLFRCAESLIHLPVLFEQVYVQIPEVNNIIFIKLPGTKICAQIRSMFFILLAKNVTCDSKFGCPKIWYRTRACSVNKIYLRNAQVDDFIELRAHLGSRLDFLDSCYGEYSLAKILEFPGEGRLNFVPLNVANELITIYTALDYQLLDSVFDLNQYVGLIELEDDQALSKSILQLPVATKKVQDITTQHDLTLNAFTRRNDKTELVNEPSNNTIQHDSSVSTSILVEITANQSDFDLKQLYNNKFTNNLIRDFLTYQNPSTSNDAVLSIVDYPLLDTTATNLNFKKTAFLIEIMLIDENKRNIVSWDYFVEFFNKFPQYDFCLMNLRSTTSSDFKKFFSKAPLKPNRVYPMGQLFVLHRSSVFGKFTCAMVTEEHLEIMEYLIEKHPFKHVISDNISKSVFEDTRYKSYIFLCDNQPIGYCVIRLDDNMQYFSSNFDVARYVCPELARNHSAILLNMDFKRIFLKRIRGYLKRVMEASNVNCLFYKLYSNSTVMEQHELSYISGVKELIPVKPRVRIQYSDRNEFDRDEKFALYHMNTRLSTFPKLSTDVKIVVVGASVTALSFLESLVFNPVNYRNSFENIVLISDCGVPYQIRLNDLEDCMVPKVAHYNYEYMKSIGLFTYVNVITGTVTDLNRFDKYVTVNEDNVSYDYLFLFNGEQLTYCDKFDETKSDLKTKSRSSNNKNDSIENLFVLNSEHDVVYAHNYIETLRNDNRMIIVYGKYIGSLTVINVLLESRVDGSRIVFVGFDVKENLPFIADESIANAVYDELERQNVRVFKDFEFDSSRLNDDRTRIDRVTFKRGTKRLKINCAGLFWFDRKRVTDVNGLTFVRSALRFDGHLVVGSAFETGTAGVHAAGPAARFARPDRLHARYDSVEIGARAAAALMDALHVVPDGRAHAAYARPLTVRCRLPGGHHYLHAAAPCPGGARPDATTVLTTGRRGRFAIVVGGRGDVLELSCYSKRDIRHTNLAHLCGKNVELFNDLWRRLKTGSVTCLFEYFEEPWAYPLYSDRFQTFVDGTARVLRRTDDETEPSESSGPAVSDGGRFYRAHGRRLRDVLLRFLDENADDLPAYARQTVESTRPVADRTVCRL